jgi:glucosamine--fructose-6-phosphate aminotransferase (isomerizing)
MCGIVGYIGKSEALDILIDGLRKLEYRGYDSAGVALFGENGVFVEKKRGRLANLEAALKAGNPPHATAGIGHTRWATHGEPSDVNSHPHTSGRVTLVHNGIIENYIPLRHSLEELGREFVSQTDTETAAHLIDYYYSETGNPLTAITLALGKIRGSYALAMMFSDLPDRIFAARCDNPLVIGVGKGENFIASDIPAILTRTRDYYLIEEQEIAELTRGGVKIYGLGGRDITAEKQLLTANWDVQAAEKGGYPHFMLKEIHEQPHSLAAAIGPRFASGLDNVLREELPDTAGIKRLVVVACGSAMHAGLLGEYAIEKYARVPVEVCIASEFRYNDPILCDGDAVVIISQSGETADSVAALRLAKSRGVPVWAVVNVVGSTIAREADRVIYIWAGPEIAVATTKAFTAQVAVLYMLALRLALDRGTLTRERAEELSEALQKLPETVASTLTDEKIAEYQRLASFNQNKHDLFFIGRGQDFALCCEGSLKLKEISYMHSEAYAAGELKHGTISLVTEGVPVIACITSDGIAEKTVSNIKEVKARGAHVILVAQSGKYEDADFCDDMITLPEADEMVMPIVGIVPLQTYAYYTAVVRGCDVDKPRNLAKSVTVE